MHEAPRGALSHWVVIDKGTFTNYQAVVPTTWNASPRDQHGAPGPYETSLIGSPVVDAESHSRSCALCIRLTPAWHVPATPSMQPVRRSRR